MSVVNDNLETTIQALKAAFPKDERDWWLIILETLNYVGVADTNHLKTTLGMTSTILKRRIEILLVSNYKGHQLIIEIPRSIKRPGQAHRPAAIYRLGEGGAALLRSLGIDARACGLTEDTQILHALSMLDFHLLALREKDITILTDRNVKFGEDRHFRPDHQVIHLNGDCFIFEIEQIVKTKHLPRIMESIANRQDFFKSKEAQDYPKEIRMILNIKDGTPAYRNTIRVWAEAGRQQETKSGQELGFTIYVISIQKFLDAPEWGSELSVNWTPIVLNEVSTEKEIQDTPTTARPRRSMEQSAALLHAFEQRQRKNLAYTELLKVDMGFVSLIEEIYAGSFGEDHQDFDSITTVPRVSMDKLREYLVEMEPGLRTILNNTMNNYRSPKAGTQVNIMHQMGRVIREFLKYHNWTVGKYLQAYPIIDSELRNSYIIKVEFLAFPNLIEYRDRRQNMEAALTWVLWALFEYAEDIGLKAPGFWK